MSTTFIKRMNRGDAVHFTGEIFDLSDQLASVAASMKEKLQDVHPKHNVPPKRRVGYDENMDLWESAKNAEVAMKAFMVSVEDVGKLTGDRSMQKPCKLVQMLRNRVSGLLGTAPLNENHSWDSYATDPVFPVRLARIMSSSITSDFVLGMTKTNTERSVDGRNIATAVVRKYELFTYAVGEYLKLYERRLLLDAEYDTKRLLV